MKRRSHDLLEGALRLSLEERARLAAELIACLDGEPDADAEAAWAVEIERRARRARDGTAKATDWPTVRNRLRGRLRK